MSEPPQRRAVALVGRPSVGKSALFNRLVGRRLAIVHEEPGVTRDRIVSEAQWDGRRFELIDTGGIGVIDRADPGDAIARGARRQVDLAIEEAAVVLLVVDAQAGRHPLDTEVARLLHRSGRRVLVAANKADNETLDLRAADFAGLGFPVHPVSALHNRGLDELLAPALRDLPPPPDPAAEPPLRVAVVGRPNAGKSSYVNCLLGHERVIVSEVPGTTRDAIETVFRIGEGPEARAYVLVDTAGMRYRGKVRTAVEKSSLLRVEDAIARADVVVHVLDATEGPTRQDKRIADLVLAHRRGCLLLVNKWDLAGGLTTREYREALYREVPFLAFAPVLFGSALTGARIPESVAALDRVAAQISARLPTGVLNRVLHRAFEARQPPALQGRRLRFFYAVQTGARPVRLRVFVNDPTLVPPAYRAFLLHRLREAFGLEGAPVDLHFVARREAEPGRATVRRTVAPRRRASPRGRR